MRLTKFEGETYIVLERDKTFFDGKKNTYTKDERIIRKIREALEAQYSAMSFSKEVLEEILQGLYVVLDLGEEASGVLCYEEDTEGY